MRKVPWVHTPTSILHWKVAVPEAIDYLGVSPGLAVLSRVLQARGHGGRAAAVARGDNGRRPHRGGVHHRAGRAELHPGAAGRRDDQRRSAIVPEATGRLGHFSRRGDFTVREVLPFEIARLSSRIRSLLTINSKTQLNYTWRYIWIDILISRFNKGFLLNRPHYLYKKLDPDKMS